MTLWRVVSLEVPNHKEKIKDETSNESSGEQS